MPTIPLTLPESLALHLPATGPQPGGVAAALDEAAALWAVKAQSAAALAEPPDPSAFPDPQAFANALEDWRDGVQARAEDALEGQPRALEAWRAWFEEESARLAGHLAEAGLQAAMQRAGAGLRAELAAACDRALAPAREGDAAAASRDARAALEQALALGVLDPAEAERAAQGLAAQVQAGLAARAADQDPENFLKALAGGDYPALDTGERERLAGRATLRLALAQAKAAQDAAQAAEDAKRLPAERGRHLLRTAEAALRAALEQGGADQVQGDPATVLDAARELAALPGFAGPAQELVNSLESLPAALALLAKTRFAPPAARFAALDAALGQAPDQARGNGRKPARPEARNAAGNPARAWPAPLAAACREVLEESAEALAADPAGYVRPEAERRLKAAGLDPAAEPEALRRAVLDLQAQAGVGRPGVLSLAEAAALRQEWRTRDAAGRVEFLASLAPFAGFRHRVAAEALGARGPVLLLAAESPALCPAEKAAVLEAAYAPAAGGPAAAGAAEQPGEGAAFTHPALEALARSEPQAATVLAELAQRLAAATQDPEDAPRLLAALAPEALRLWGQAPVLTPQSEHASEYRQDEGSPYPPTGDENSGPAKPKEEEDTLQGGVGEETLAGGGDVYREKPGIERKGDIRSKLINPTGGALRHIDPHGSGRFLAPREGARQHTGVDYSAEVGAAVVAPITGKREVNGKGNIVIVSDPEDDGTRYRTTLVHVNAKDKKGTVGKRTDQGDAVGEVQDPAGYVLKDPGLMTPHVHTKLEIKTKQHDWMVVNPDDYMETPDAASGFPPGKHWSTPPFGSRRR